jgi:hypothetical protein
MVAPVCGRLCVAAWRIFVWASSLRRRRRGVPVREACTRRRCVIPIVWVTVIANHPAPFSNSGSAADQTKGHVRDGGAIFPERGRACDVGRYPAGTTPARRPYERDADAAEIRVLRPSLHRGIPGPGIIGSLAAGLRQRARSGPRPDRGPLLRHRILTPPALAQPTPRRRPLGSGR